MLGWTGVFGSRGSPLTDSSSAKVRLSAHLIPKSVRSDIKRRVYSLGILLNKHSCAGTELSALRFPPQVMGLSCRRHFTGAGPKMTVFIV